MSVYFDLFIKPFTWFMEFLVENNLAWLFLGIILTLILIFAIKSKAHKKTADANIVRSNMNPLQIAKTIFEEIQNEFPYISMEVNDNDKNVDLNVNIPEQRGVTCPINLNLQGDELHFAVSNFWCEWFPCTDPSVASNYKDTVIGYLKGESRILEHFKGEKVYKAKLQAPDKGGNWKTIATWSTLSWPLSSETSEIIVKNY